MRRVLALASAVALGAALAAARPPADAASLHPFTDEEVSRILSMGPWPSPPARDPSNRVSGSASAAELGRLLFFDAGLSATGTLSCASCHDPRRGFSDGLARAQGIARHDRNAQGLLDVARQRWFGWDGGADSLWAASIRPLLAPGEMGSSAARVAARIAGESRLRAAYGLAFGVDPGEAARPGAEDAVLADAAKAIAAFLETLASPRTAFDEFRDALAHQDAAAIARYPADAQRGLKIFVGRGNCWVCHFGPGFSNGEFHDVGMPFLVEPGRVDPGRYAGIQRVRGDRFNLLGAFNDQPAQPDSLGQAASLKTATVNLQHRNWGEWRTPSLRGLGATAPYMHDGRLATLRDVVRHYSELNEDRLHADGEALLKPLRLADAEIDDLLAFLRSLDPP